jgi:hypothetical protein
VKEETAGDAAPCSGSRSTREEEQRTEALHDKVISESVEVRSSGKFQEPTWTPSQDTSSTVTLQRGRRPVLIVRSLPYTYKGTSF